MKPSRFPCASTLSPIELEFEKMKKIVLSLITALGLMVGAQANTGGIAWDMTQFQFLDQKDAPRPLSTTA